LSFCAKASAIWSKIATGWRERAERAMTLLTDQRPASQQPGDLRRGK
jgi:hypothetical protein